MIAKIKTLDQLYQKAEKDDDYKKLIICTLSNLGCEHLARGGDSSPKWKRHYQGLET